MNGMAYFDRGCQIFFFYIFQAKQVADPISRESYIEQKKKQKIEEECASRITVSHHKHGIVCQSKTRLEKGNGLALFFPNAISG